MYSMTSKNMNNLDLQSTQAFFAILAIAAIVIFCFWKPDLPYQLALKLGFQTPTTIIIFLILYWLSIPLILYRLMTLLWRQA